MSINNLQLTIYHFTSEIGENKNLLLLSNYALFANLRVCFETLVASLLYP